MSKRICEFCADCYQYDDGECEGSIDFPEKCEMTSPETVFEYMDDYEKEDIIDEILYNLSTGDLLEVPGIMEILEHHFNDEIKRLWHERFMANYR
jgi:hypothetical protein